MFTVFEMIPPCAYVGEQTYVDSFNAVGGLTFLSRPSLGINAQYSLGSSIASFTAARSASAPATYIDASGIIQVTTTSDTPRITLGYYPASATGGAFTAYTGLLMESAATNYLFRTNNTTTANITGGTCWTGWAGEFNTSTTPVYSNVLIPELSSVSGALSQRIRWSGTATNNNVKITSANTGVGTFVQGDVVCLSGWMRSQTGNTDPGGTMKCGIEVFERNAAGTNVGGTNGTNFIGSLTTSWKRFFYTYTIAQATTSQISTKIGSQAGVDTGDVYDVEYACLQIEKGVSFPSTWVPTTTANATRPIETLTFNTLTNRTAATETFLARVVPYWGGALPSVNSAITDTDTKSRIMSLKASTDKFRFAPNVTDTSGNDIDTTTTPVIYTNYVVVGACDSTVDPNSNIYLNGSSQATSNTDFTANAWGTNFYVGTSSAGLTFNGIVNSVAIYNRVLTSGEVTTVTNLMNNLN